MTLKQRIVAQLQSIAPNWATNAQLKALLGETHHQAVFIATRDLAKKGTIRSQERGGVWHFASLGAPGGEPEPVVAAQYDEALSAKEGTGSSATFEALARRVMAQHFGVSSLGPARIQRVHKIFDFVSGDHSIVGDAKYYSMVRGQGRPNAKLSVISEHVWLLEKVNAATRFLVFGNDRRVPLTWLNDYGRLVAGVDFYFLSDDGKLERL